MVRNTTRLLELIKNLEASGKKNKKQFKAFGDKNKRLLNKNKSLIAAKNKLETTMAEQSKLREQILERGPNFQRRSK